MRSIPSEILAQLNKRQGIKVRTLYWIRAKNRATGAEETLGVWNGEDTRTFVINGTPRGYVGGGGFIQFNSLKHEMNLNIQRLVANANPVSPEFQNVLRLYDPKGARVEVHIAVFDTETDQLVADPYRVYKGWINTAPIKTGAKNGESTVTINHVGHSRILTRLLPAKRSDDNQRKRLGTDGFFKYVAITGTIQTAWGSKTVGDNINRGNAWGKGRTNGWS